MDGEGVVLDPEPPQALEALEEALQRSGDEREAGLRGTVSAWPTCLDAWARLAEHAYERGDDVAAYAYARVGYHRGLDRLRGAGWRGEGAAPYTAPENRGLLRSLYELMRAAAAIGEGVEARRCREFLLTLDPDDHFGVGDIRPAALSRRLPEHGGGR